MSIELITGASSTPHISANDYRAVNRSNYGQGRYVLRDAEEMRVSVAPASGIIAIDTGSVMWYGMHIRCESDTTLNYTPPTATTPVYVYMHYVKEASTGYESVDWVVSVGVQKTENNTPADNVIDAYTLFASFTHNPTTQTADNLITHFVLIDSHDDFNMPTIRAEIEAKHKEATDYINTNIAEIKSTMDRVFLGGSSANLKDQSEIQLSDALSNYRFIGFGFNGGATTASQFLIPFISNSTIMNIPVWNGSEWKQFQFRQELVGGKTKLVCFRAPSTSNMLTAVYGYK